MYLSSIMHTLEWLEPTLADNPVQYQCSIGNSAARYITGITWQRVPYHKEALATVSSVPYLFTKLLHCRNNKRKMLDQQVQDRVTLARWRSGLASIVRLNRSYTGYWAMFRANPALRPT